MLILPLIFVVVALVLLFAFTNGFHDAANVVATIIYDESDFSEEGPSDGCNL